jgi:hypothetical protein
VSQGPSTKGVNFRSFSKTLLRLRGQDTVRATFDLLPNDLRESLYYGSIVSSGWYPIDWYAKLHAAAQRATGEGPELSRQIAREALSWDFRNVHKFVRIALSPETLMRVSTYVMRFYYTMGRFEVLNARPGSGEAVFTGFEGFDRNLWQDTLGGVEAVLELAGAKETKITVLAGGGDGDSFLKAEAIWRMK